MSSSQTSGVFGVFKPFPSKPDKNTYSQEGFEKGDGGLFVSTITEVQQTEKFLQQGY